MEIRKLELNDLRKDSFFQTLSNLRPIDKLPISLAEKIFEECKERGIGIYVAEDDGLVVGTVRLLFEPKFYHSGKLAAHIEDVATHSDSIGIDTNSSYAGGLVGLANNSLISASYATGDVTGESIRVGGLVGGTNSNVENSYATGDVTGDDRVGGLVGGLTGDIVNSYSIGKVVANGNWIFNEEDGIFSDDGGGGGGGYFGGEGGQSDASPGAGGSGYLNPLLISDGILTTGNNGVGPERALPPNVSDENYIEGVGLGGNHDSNSGNGLIYLSYGASHTAFIYTGDSQTFTVPSGITSIEVKIWGAGGGGSDYDDEYQGGSGGYASGTIAVTPGQELVVIVGGGGGNGFRNIIGGFGGFGGGGYGTRGDASGGGGGGLSGIFKNDSGTSFELLTQSDAIIIAGGGGGGTGYSGPGGAGGGESGNDGEGSSNISCGGTQLAGGSCLESGSDGSALHGGNGDSRGIKGTSELVINYSGGLVGYNYGNVANSFWNTETSEQSESNGGVGATTSQLKALNTFVDANWNIENNNADLNNGYPYLSWQGSADSSVWFMPRETHALAYTASAGGTVSGETSQTINEGGSGTEVTAVPNSGYRFVRWSDDSTANPRTDTSVIADISVSAIFEAVSSGGSSPIISPPGIGIGARDASGGLNAVINIGEINNLGVNTLTYQGNLNNFIAPQSGIDWNLANHSFQITSLDLLGNIATILIQSEPITVTLKKGESKEIDLDSDKINDIRATFTDVYINRAEITVVSLKPQTKDDPALSSGPVCPSAFFVRDLKLGMAGNDVKELQKYLNSHNAKLADSGIGSSGKEVNFFGVLTKKALAKFQKSNNLKATGIFDLSTRQYLGCGTVTEKPKDILKFNRDLKLGAVGDDVKELQRYLNNHGFVLTKEGAGSPGKETSLFGRLAKEALIRFQKANNIIPASGYFGSITRKLINGN